MGPQNNTQGVSGEGGNSGGSDQPAPQNDRHLTLGEHLNELRIRLIRALIIFLVAVGVCIYFQDFLMEIALKPHIDATRYANKMNAEKMEAELARENPYARASEALNPNARSAEARAVIDTFLGTLENAALASEIRRGLDNLDCADAILGEKFSTGAYVAAARAAADVRFKVMSSELPDSPGKAALLAYADGEIGNSGAMSRIIAASEKERRIRELESSPQKLLNLKYTEAFMSYFLLSLVAAAILSFPFIAWQIWGFISVGLYRKERMVVYKFVPFSVILFAAGVLFGYFILIPTGLSFLAAFGNQALMENSFTLGFYLSLAAMLTFVTGIIFETPLVMFIIAKIGLISAKGFSKFRKYFIVIAFVIAAFITPTPDAITQTLVAVPMILLYEFGIILARFAGKKPEPAPVKTN